MRKRKKRGAGCSVVVFAAILVGLAVYFTMGEGRLAVLQRTHPLQYREYVEQYSAQNGLDPYLVYAVIKTESRFRPDAVSSAGARGLMQLMEETALDSAEELHMEIQIPEDLFDPEINIMLGTHCLRKLLDYYGSTELALAAYNGGTGNVRKWLNDESLTDGSGGLVKIPFEETEKYVNKVLRTYGYYREAYEGGR